MTEAQIMRYKRRAERAAKERKERLDTALGILILVLFLAAFALAGTIDREIERHDLAFWAERGVTVQRW